HPVPGLPRWPGRGRRSRGRRGVRWPRGRQGPAHLPADPPTRADRRPLVRDRVPRRGRGGVLLHVRLIRGRGDAPVHRALAVASIGSNPVTFIDAAITDGFTTVGPRCSPADRT